MWFVPSWPVKILFWPFDSLPYWKFSSVGSDPAHGFWEDILIHFISLRSKDLTWKETLPRRIPGQTTDEHRAFAYSPAFCKLGEQSQSGQSKAPLATSLLSWFHIGYLNSLAGVLPFSNIFHMARWCHT
jgi:hypothetical protein